MADYRHFCIYCGKLIPPDAKLCPFCGMEDPFTMRCPRCRNVIEKGWARCSCCGLELFVICPSCGKRTFAASCCEQCGASLTVRCANRKCGFVQVKMGDRCLRCNKKLK
ncbi:MAG: zinc ribbon domain-containing protein [Clostridia bacterium]|nr:zinc ribbon domain-containing protein [Clostridia bacterium]MDR3644182.1 zinc ribbon domain-containing protein [Clostridia bacterium]